MVQQVTTDKNKAMATINASQLQQILDLNSKSIEIYLEVNSQYESIIKVLEEIKERDGDHIGFCDENIKKINEKMVVISECASQNQNFVKESMAKIEKSLNRQEVIISTSLITIILSILSKLLFGV